MSATLDSQLFQAALLERLFSQQPKVHVGRYEVRARVAEGGGGRVYEGHDPDLNRPVAIKLPRVDPVTISRLRQEARTLAGLSHPAVVEVYDVVDSPWGLAVILAWVEGGTLSAWQTQSDRTAREVVEAYVAAGRGLAAVHACGLVHRDFKPDNVLMTDAGPQLCDFGLARSAMAEPGVVEPHAAWMEEGRVTLEGAAPGTPAFMSPEQRAGVATAKGDQYSWCLSLRAALAELPAAADPEDLGRAVDDAIERGLSHDSTQRHGSLEVLLDVVARALDRRAGRSYRRTATFAAAGLLVLALCVAWWSMLRPETPRVDAASEEVSAAADDPALERAVAAALADFERARDREIEFSTAAESLETAYGLADSAGAFGSMALLATRLATTQRAKQDIPAAQRWSEAALNAIERGDLHDDPLAAGVWTSRAALALDERQPASALESTARAQAILDALPLAEQQEHATERAGALFMTARALIDLGELEGALERLTQARGILEATGEVDGYAYAPMLVGQAHVLGELGRTPEQVAVSERILKTCPDTQSRCLAVRQHALLLLAEATPTEDWESFDRLCNEALELAKREVEQSEASALSVRAHIFRQRADRRRLHGDLAGAERELSMAIDESLSRQRAYFPPLLKLRAELRIEQGKYRDARADAVDLARYGGPEDKTAASALQDRIARETASAPP